MAVKKPAVIGQFTGKCCDANVVNNNDMHLGKELFENLFASDEYKRAMENRHYIGFIGHPNDPGCQDYKDACIVMTDCHLDESGDVYGTFDLIDTPVGRIVKTFIDAGVTFGISIRGAGDVASDGEVDPETFCFRGFDLVTFPAYDDCIPEFREIAASTDLNKQKKFKKVCAAIDSNLKEITSCDALKVIQEQFTEGTDEFNKIGERIDELSAGPEVTAEDADREAVLEQQVAALTDLYTETVNEKNSLVQSLADSQAACSSLEIACARKIASYKRIVASQVKDLQEENAEITRKAKIQASRSLNQIDSLKDQLAQANSISERLKENNLKYNQKIQSNSVLIAQKDSTIDDLKSQLSETVTASKRLEKKTSDLDAEKESLLSRVTAAEKLVLEYQQVYADMYANALGVHLDNLPITASTSVQGLKEMISAGTSTSNMMSGAMVDDILEDDDLVDSIDLEDETLITT